MLIFKVIVGMIINISIFVGLLLVPAGTWQWPRALVFLGVALVGTAGSTVSLFRANPELLKERFKAPIQKGQPLADKVIVLLFIAAFLGWIVFIPLDVFRFHLLGQPGILVSLLGLALLMTGWWINDLAFKENAFAAPVVKLQEERHHRVIDTGLYGLVRHPMYAGVTLLLVGMALWLGSYAAAMLAAIPVGLLVLRILVEEQFLRRELAGYDAYRQKVRYRLIPFLW